MGSTQKTFCKKDIISHCEHNKDPNIQKECSYYEKATKADRCIDLRFEKFCTSMDAQYNVKNI